MNRCIVFIAVIIILYSCSNKSDSTLVIFKASEEGFLQSNKAISNSSNQIYHALDEKLLKPESAHQASVWQPKALAIKEKSAEIINYLDLLIIELKKDAGIKLVDMKEVYREGDLDAVSRLFINKNTGEELYEKLQEYKKYILAVDPGMKQEFGSNSIIISYRFENEGGKNFTKTFFDGVPAIAAIAMLRKFENNVRVLENKFITYCLNQISSTGWDGFLKKISVIVSQNTKVVKAGDEMQIEAGVGEFSVASVPVITINGKVFEPKDFNGVVSYKFKTSLKPGKYSVPVNIEYIEFDGRKQFFERKVEYTVVE